MRAALHISSALRAEMRDVVPVGVLGPRRIRSKDGLWICSLFVIL
jgi:hypothetical protein